MGPTHNLFHPGLIAAKRLPSKETLCAIISQGVPRDDKNRPKIARKRGDFGLTLPCGLRIIMEVGSAGPKIKGGPERATPTNRQAQARQSVLSRRWKGPPAF